MKPSVNLQLKQQLTITPQLQYAIKMLQLSALELELEIQAAVDSNPLLEREEENPENLTVEAEPVVTAWDDIYQDADTSYASHSNSEHDLETIEVAASIEQSLHDYLYWQLNLTPFSERDNLIALTIIDYINDDGYLSSSLEEIYHSLQQLQLAEIIEMNEIVAVLHRIQQFDPVGVGSRDLKECLLIQLKLLPKNTPFAEQTKLLIEQHLDLLGQKNYGRLKSRLNVSDTELEGMVSLLTDLHPRPGTTINTGKSDYIIPDVIVSKQNNNWLVALNKHNFHKLRINANYAVLIKRADTSRDNKFLTAQLNEAKWFIKSLQNRNETLLKVATCIIEQQQVFLEQGDEGMKPLILQDVAQAVGLHESTISRVTTNKYIHTPRGIYELKYFFSSSLNSINGINGINANDRSSTAIKALIKRCIQEENQGKPLSDQQISQLLATKGIKIARRTIAKYRESMLIFPSNQRKNIV